MEGIGIQELYEADRWTCASGVDTAKLTARSDEEDRATEGLALGVIEASVDSRTDATSCEYEALDTLRTDAASCWGEDRDGVPRTDVASRDDEDDLLDPRTDAASRSDEAIVGVPRTDMASC